MKIVVLGGTGLIGKKVVQNLHQQGHEVVPASPSLGINALTGDGLAEALTGADVVVDVTNSPSFEDQAVLEFFQKSARNLLPAEAAAGVKHHVALSVVGAERLPDSGYMRAKIAQEKLIKSSSTPFTIVRATQFFEFLGGIGESAVVNGEIHLPPALMQPMAADDVAAAVSDAAVSAPLNDMIEIAGPEAIPMDEAVRRYLAATGDSRPVIEDSEARYFGAHINDESITPGANPLLGPTYLDQWLGQLKPAALAAR